MLLFCVRTNERRRSIEECLDGEKRKKRNKKNGKNGEENATHMQFQIISVSFFIAQCMVVFCFQVCSALHRSHSRIYWLRLLYIFQWNVPNGSFYLCALSLIFVVFLFEWRLVLQMTFLTLDISMDLNWNTKVNLSPQVVFFCLKISSSNEEL